MKVYVLMREDQNEHGFVDTSIVGVYWTRRDAEAEREDISRDARECGLRVEGDDTTPAGEWQVDLEIHECDVDGTADVEGGAE